jgi:urease alpha subunit
MHVIRRSTRRREPNAELILVDRLVRGCNLMGKAGRVMDRAWTTGNVMEKATNFWVNDYINLDMFTITRYFDFFIVNGIIKLIIVSDRV